MIHHHTSFLLLSPSSSLPHTSNHPRWELYEGHLRASSARAALAGFEGEVRRLSQAKAQEAVAAAADGSGGDGGGSGGSMPLTKGEMAAVLAEVNFTPPKRK